MNVAIDIRDLEKRFDRHVAVEAIRFAVEEGELFGLIGPDGAGKTTLMRMLVSLLLPTAGSATVDGLDVVADFRKLRSRIGYMPGRFSLYMDLSVEENLRFYATVFGTTVEAGRDLYGDVYKQIEPFRKRRARDLSGGMKQKLALSCALVHHPRVLFLDEPTTGVDAVSRKEFWDTLDRLKRLGMTILVSTPYMDEAERCDRVALMQDGRLLGVAVPAQMGSALDDPLFAVQAEGRRTALMQALRDYPESRSVFAFGRFTHVTTGRAGAQSSSLQDFLEGRGFSSVSVDRIQPTVEDTFMALMIKDSNRPGRTP